MPNESGDDVRGENGSIQHHRVTAPAPFRSHLRASTIGDALHLEGVG